MSDTTIDGTIFTRARRNLVLTCALILIYCTGAVKLADGTTSTSLFLPLKLGNVLILEIWLAVFLFYFYWRFNASQNGREIYEGLLDDITAALKPISLKRATEHFDGLFPGVFVRSGDSESYWLDNVGTKAYTTFTYGEVKVPIIGLHTSLHPFYMPLDQSVSGSDIFVMTEGEAAYHAHTLARSQVWTHNHRSEYMLPYYLARLSWTVICAHWGYHFVKALL